MARNQDIADLFVRGHTSGGTAHMFIEGNAIYSYGHHFPIAVRMGGGRYLLNSQGYSNTTAHHKGRVRRAIASVGGAVTLGTTADLKNALSGSGGFGFGGNNLLNPFGRGF